MLSRRLLRIKVVKALYAHLQSEAENMLASEKSLMSSVDKAYDLYFQMLALPPELTRYAAERIELNRRKKLPTHEDLHPNTKFVDNAVVRVLANSDSVNDRLAARKLGWARQRDLVRTLYGQLVASDYYREYMAREERSFADDLRLVERFYEEMQECEALDEALDELSIQWNGDLGFILAMVLRTLGGLKPSHLELKIMPEFKSEDDRDFVRTLFEKSLVMFDENRRFIERFARNWDVERLVFMDHLILCVALTELVSFPSIPVKVTLDEYIEISKYYSTPGSSVFINGILDKAVEALDAEGRIQKSGRGLLDTAPKA